ncbi:MAG: hypothetical protein CM15mP117_22720 [Alphaproteobacteria bacterium]|nr:MAG: hypothetical protein CM15mP117_22720 [Alphaproteobacteria bacterium]
MVWWTSTNAYKRNMRSKGIPKLFGRRKEATNIPKGVHMLMDASPMGAWLAI